MPWSSHVIPSLLLIFPLSIHYTYIGTVEDLEALKGAEEDEENEKDESESAAKFMKKSKSAPKGKKIMTAAPRYAIRS